MSLATDVRSVSENAIEQLADRFDELPRPVLAAIGVGGFAIEQWTELRRCLIDQLTRGLDHPADVLFIGTGLPSRAQRTAGDYAVKVQHTAADYAERLQETAGRVQGMATGYVGKVPELPARVQKAVTELPGKATQAVAVLPEKTQKLVSELGGAQHSVGEVPLRGQQVAGAIGESLQAFAQQIPATAQALLVDVREKLAQLTNDLSLESVLDTVEAYVELVSKVYGSLVVRGEKTWSGVRSSSLEPGTVVDALVDTPVKAARAARSAARRDADATPAAGRIPRTTRVTTPGRKTARAAKAGSAKADAAGAPAASDPTVSEAAAPTSGASTAPSAEPAPTRAAASTTARRSSSANTAPRARRVKAATAVTGNAAEPKVARTGTAKARTSTARTGTATARTGSKRTAARKSATAEGVTPEASRSTGTTDPGTPEAGSSDPS